MTVHIVEDDPGVCDSLALLVRQLGHETHTHEDAESFFERPPPGPRDTIIVDLRLPGISGAQVIRWLQGLARPPRVIAMTGESLFDIERELRGLVVPAVIRKPLSQETVAALL